MSEEEGLRGGWFSAEVLMMTDKEALVVYDNLLTDDGLLSVLFLVLLSTISTAAKCPSIRLPSHVVCFCFSPLLSSFSFCSL